MKRIYLFFILFFASLAQGQVLSDNKIWVTFADTSTVLLDEKTTNKSGINSILNEYDVTKVIPLFPFAKTPLLRHTYEISTDKVASLYAHIVNDRSLFSNCERVYEQQDLYNPSDWMWYYTVSNNYTDDWLWYLVKIQAADAWDITKGDPDIKIAVVDNGFDYQHPDLQSKIYPPYDFFSGVQEPTTNDHGTSVASILAAETADQGETPIGTMASIGYNSKIMVSAHSVPACLYASTILKADILSISWYNTSCSPSEYFLAVEQEILNNGTIIVRAAGNGIANCGGGRLYPFSGYEDARVIVVSSTDFDDNHTNPLPNGVTNSHYPEVDICAPGYKLMGAVHSHNGTVDWPYYGGWGGTSQSTPIVSGVCALIKSVNRCLTPEDVQDIIKQTADSIKDEYLYPGLLGAGRVNAYKAVALAQTYHNQNDTITSNVTWSTHSFRGGTVVIDSLSSLTITGTLYCTPTTRIIVRPGGKLIVDGGTLTSACTGEMWQGIFVEGHSHLHQTEANQGKVVLRNGAVIENALCGIRTGSPSDTSNTSTGGIILAQDATFRNCARAVYMGPYTDYNPVTGILKPNASSFTRCTFTLDNDNLIESYGARFSELTRLWGVAGVRFAGCTFSNTSSIDSRGCGIRAEDAGFRVDTYCSQEIMNSDCSCPGQYATHSTFSGFSTAVWVSTTGSPFAVTVDETSFANNSTGISVSGNNHATVTRCQFDLSLSPELPYSAMGLNLSACTGFLVEGNAFSRSTSTFPTYGVKAAGLGISNNSLYRNTFTGLTYGIHSSGNNGGSFSGLRFSCNTFLQNTHDIYVASGQVAETQGSSAAGADNSFSSGATGNLEFLNPKSLLDYHYSTGGSHSPMVHTSNVLLHPNALANGCASTLCTGGGVIKGLPEYRALSNSVNVSSADSDDADGRADRASVLQEMSDIASANIRDIEGGATIDVEALKDWFAAISDTWSEYSLAETEYLAGESNALTLQGVSALLATLEERDEYDNYMAFNALKEALSGDIDGHANWPVATEGQIAELQRIAEAGTGRSSVMAHGVLCFFFGICYDDGIQMAETRRAAAKDGGGYMPVLTDDSLSFSIAFMAEIPLKDSDPYYLGARSVLFASGTADTVIFNNNAYRAFKADSFHPLGHYMYLRENTATGQLFRYYPEFDTEVITCDLTLQPGDTFLLPTVQDFTSGSYEWLVYYYEDLQQPCWIVDSVTYEAGRKVVWFPPIIQYDSYLSSQYLYRPCFIEGVGPAFGPFGHVDHGFSHNLGLLLCVHHNDSLVYMTDTVLGCEQYVISVPEYPDALMKIYPNPATNTLHVEFEGTDNPQGTITVTDLTGVVVLTRECNSPVTQLDVSNLSPGLYVVAFRNGKGVAVRKFVKM